MSRRKTVTFELAASSERKRSVRDFRRQCYSLMGRTDLLQDEGVAGSVQQRLDDQLNLIEARLGDETVGTIRWGTYVSVAGSDHYADSIIQNKNGLPNSEPESFSRTDRLIIHPKYRRGTVLIGLARFCLRLAMESGSQFDLCWSEKPLTRVYQRLGYTVLPQRFVNARSVTLYPQILNIQQFGDRWSARTEVRRQSSATPPFDQNQLSTSC
ncbi:MAG: hypothetical protein ACR2N1_11385 [Rubripirellula sp.]